MLFNEMSHFLQLSAKKLPKTEDHDSLCQNLLVLAKSMIFHAFSRNEQLFDCFGRKVSQNAKPRYFVQKVARFGRIDDFLRSFTK